MARVLHTSLHSISDLSQLPNARKHGTFSSHGNAFVALPCRCRGVFWWSVRVRRLIVARLACVVHKFSHVPARCRDDVAAGRTKSGTSEAEVAAAGPAPKMSPELNIILNEFELDGLWVGPPNLMVSCKQIERLSSLRSANAFNGILYL